MQLQTRSGIQLPARALGAPAPPLVARAAGDEMRAVLARARRVAALGSATPHGSRSECRAGAVAVAVAAFSFRPRRGLMQRRGLAGLRHNAPSVRRATDTLTPTGGEAEAVAEAPAAQESTGAREGKAKKPVLRLERSADDGSISRLTLTTPLFYANGSPHIGSAYPTIAADVLSRYGAMRGGEVHFVTGMDEHGEKIAQTAAGKDLAPQQLVDEVATEFESLWGKLAIQNHHFARTTLPQHKQIVAEMWQRCKDSGDIYKKEYEGWYCVGCEAYLDDDEMEKGHVCKIHQKPCELRREENYFFRLSKYWDRLIQHLKENPDFILPKSRGTEVFCWLNDDNKRDFSISRTSTSWGIPVPGDDSQVIYVWFDALLGYLSSLLQPGDEATLEMALKRGWPADVHVIGKDILRFHALYWPAMLMSAGLPLPKHIVTHGFLTKDGLKMGKSLGNVVEPVPLVEAFGSDAVRFYFGSCLSFGEDGDFSYEIFIKRVNSALANELGNLVQRLLSLCRKNLPEPVAPDDVFDTQALEAHPVYRVALEAPAEVATFYEQFDLSRVAQKALHIAGAANLHINEVAPWAKLKSEDEEERSIALHEMVLMSEAVRICAVLLAPLTPDTSMKILAELHGEPQPVPKWSDAAWAGERALAGLAMGHPKPTPVFPRIDVEPWKGK